MIHLVTYATHSEGKFEELTKNKDLVVLGFGKKWNGFDDKIRGVLEYMKDLKDNDIVCYIDGFDSVLIKDSATIEKRFKASGSKVLFSEEIPGFLKYIVFNTCNKRKILNAGLFMGYVQNLRPVLEDTLQMKCKDDQVNINNLCKKYDSIDIDTDHTVFHNALIFDKNPFPDTCVVSYPAQIITVNKIIRGVQSYTQFFVVPLLALLIALGVQYPTYRLHLVLLAAILAASVDFSCVSI
jgi:hypothetical protein